MKMMYQVMRSFLPVILVGLAGCQRPHQNEKINYENSTFFMRSPKIGYECELSIAKGGKWTIVERSKGKILEIQTGSYFEDKSSHVQALNFGKFHLHVDWLKSLDDTSVTEATGDFSDPSMYFDNENTLVLGEAGNYIFRREPPLGSK